MIQFQPNSRTCIADIRRHPWLTSEDVATDDEVKIELIERTNRYDQQNAQQAEATRIERENQGLRNEQVRRDGDGHRDVCGDVVFEGKVYVIGDDIPKDQKNVDLDRVRLEERPLKSRFNPLQCIFSDMTAAELWVRVDEATEKDYLEVSNK